MRIREPRTTALIFWSGKVVCTGAKSEDQSRLAARKLGRIVEKIGFAVKFLDFKGLICRIVKSCVVLLIFTNVKVIITGAKVKTSKKQHVSRSEELQETIDFL